jgi:D-psicose/D-tagatose/L-ribulose 3-epimerase
MVPPFRFSVCNEVFENTPFDEACRSIRTLGYAGIEVAPFTLAEFPNTIPSGDRARYRRIIEEEGLTFVGLHWLMVSPKGLHVTTPDAALRARSWDHIRHLIDLCADLGDGGVMVFGSPNQRNTTGGMTRERAKAVFAEELGRVAPHAEERGVRILVEALPAAQSDVINSLSEAVAIVEEIGSPAVRTMFDTHNAVDEPAPHAELVRKYFDYIAHVHVNEMDGREPGTGNYDFGEILSTLWELKYKGWVSLEAFDFSRGADIIAGGALQHLKMELERVAKV